MCNIDINIGTLSKRSTCIPSVIKNIHAIFIRVRTISREKRFSHVARAICLLSAETFLHRYSERNKADAISFPSAEISMKSPNEGNDRPVVLTFFLEHIYASGGKALSEAQARNTVIKNELGLRPGAAISSAKK